MIAIKHRYTDTTLCEFDVETVKQATEKGKANLYGADLRGADLRGADLYGADLRGAYLDGANLDGANLYGAYLSGANLDGANLRCVNLDGANLRCVNLDGANLYGAYLDGANLDGANLDGANLYGAYLSGADLDGEKLTKSPLVITGLRYWCLISDGYMRLGCKRFTHEEWAEFSDDEIEKMDSCALEFWKQWKESLLAMCKAHAVKPVEEK